MLKVMIIGASGKMGQETVLAIESAEDLSLVATVNSGDDLVEAIQSSKPDVAIDFTRPDLVYIHATTLLAHGVHSVIGTTGLTENQLKSLDQEAKEKNLGIAVCPNFAIGAILMMQFAAKAAKYMPKLEIIEYHHDKKLDAPSGTALKTADLIKKENPSIPTVPIHSVRLQGIVANQDVILGGEGQTLTLKHETINRKSFMPGVLMVVRQITSKPGLTYGLEHFLD